MTILRLRLGCGVASVDRIVSVLVLWFGVDSDRITQYMASRRPSPTPRRIVALKRADGEPLTRIDVQYDFLHAIFGDSHSVFTNPYPTNGAQPSDKLCFRDLYIKSISHSPKATKALKDKMTESSVFSLDFAMLSLLVNVGRINTTMSC